MLDEAIMAPHDASMSAQHSNDMEGPSTLEHNDDSNVFSAKNELPNASHTSSALTKKKKKKKKAKNTAPASEIASDDSVSDIVGDMADPESDPDTIDSWRAKAKQRLALLHDLNENARRIKEELTIAHQRAADAEEAESLVNEGLKTATSLLTERDRQVSDLTSTNASLRAELNTTTEEKKKVDKRLALVKTIGSNLQEAKEAAAASEKRLEEAMLTTSRLRASLASAQAEISELAPLRDVIAARNVEIQALRAALDAGHGTESTPSTCNMGYEKRDVQFMESPEFVDASQGDRKNMLIACVGAGGAVAGAALMVILRAAAGRAGGPNRSEEKSYDK